LSLLFEGETPMAALSCRPPAGRDSREMAQFDEVVELSVLLPSWQAEALENAAQNQGLTTAQMVRLLIRNFFNHLHAFQPMND
jgi:hypothetical protein